MNLYGRKTFTGERPTEDGYPVVEQVLDLAYWRKHYRLHDFICRNAAEVGEDSIELLVSELQEIINAVKQKTASDTPETDERTIQSLENAICWVQTKDENCRRSVYYEWAP